jgi:lipopolysaccharide/colanic/teichoic acid biosynthesis glycosyltransferase
MTNIQRTKRILDVVVATAIFLASTPLLLAVTLLLLILEGRPIFYISRRYISADRAIPVIKFRTMVRDAHSPKYRLEERFMRDGYLDIPRTCEVYTPLGRLLERLQIVELPQMLNVLFHGMSLIGNRPLPAANLKLLRRYPEWRRRFESPAGITGIAQVIGKLQLAPEERLDLEIAYSEIYQQGNVLWCDLRIFFETLKVILISRQFGREEAYRLLRIEPRQRAMAAAGAAGSSEAAGSRRGIAAS